MELPDDPDRVPVKATLIVIPPVRALTLNKPAKAEPASVSQHLCAQWPSEIKKFTKGAKNGGPKVIVIKDVGGLKKNTIEDIQTADIIVIADTVFKSPLYWPQLWVSLLLCCCSRSLIRAIPQRRLDC